AEKAEKDLETSRAKHRAADLARSALGTTITALRRDVDDATRKVESLLSEKTTLMQQIQAADERIAELDKDLETARKEFSGQQDRREFAERIRTIALAKEEELAGQLNELRLALATEQQRHDNLISQRQPMTAREAELI